MWPHKRCRSVLEDASCASHEEFPPYPPQLSEAVIASFSITLPSADPLLFPSANADNAASCQAEFAAAAAQAQACLRRMRATWLRWHQLCSVSPGPLGPHLPNSAHQSPPSAPSIASMSEVVSPNDSLFDKCNRAASASLLVSNETFLRRVFNRHADQGSPLTLSKNALGLALRALGIISDDSAVTTTSAHVANLFLYAPINLEQFKSNARPCVDCGDVDLDTVFFEFADAGGLMSLPALVNAMKYIDLEVFSEQDSAADHLFARAGAANSESVDFSGFKRIVQRKDELDAFLADHQLGAVAPAIRAIIGTTGDDQLRCFSQLKQDDLYVAACASVAAIHAQLQTVHKQVHDAAVAKSKHLKVLAQNPGKFSVFKMASGSIDDFHKGLMDRIGHPNLNFRKGMQSEHMTRGGYDFVFTTSNYYLTTQPFKEWLYIVGDATGQKLDCPEEHLHHGRTIHSIEELLQKPLARSAELTREEIIAVVMYTGPMFAIYNAVLRRFPAEIYDVFKAANNLFPTTIFVLVSAIQKLSRCMDIPPGTLLYRGLGGIMELPDSFFSAASNCKTPNALGYTEFGFMSTTAEKGVAVQYSGVKDNKPKSSIMCICPNSVDRGADISEFSQYPAEKEFLFVPYSFIQGEGRLRSEVADGGGVVTVISARVNINLKTETVEELLQKKKHAHLVTANAMVDEVSSELDEWQVSCEAQDRLQQDWSRSFRDLTPTALAASIVAQCKAVVTRHEATAAEAYVNDGTFRALVNEILEIKAWAIEKKELWMQDVSRPIDFLEKFSLLDCHRMWQSFLRKQIAQAPPGSPEKASRSVQLLVSRGLIKNEVKDDLNADGEGVLVRAGGDGWSEDSIDAALCAGADVHQTDSDERTGVWLAASYGHSSSMKALLSAGCSADICWRRYSVSPVYIASCSGHADCLKLLLDAGSDYDKRNNVGCSPCWTAASYGNAECLALLLAAKADFNQCDNQGRSPLYMAANNNRLACLEQLLAAGADAASSYENVSALENCRIKCYSECTAVLAAALQGKGDA